MLRTGGSSHAGQAALPQRNIHTHKTFICSVVVIFHLRIIVFINLSIDTVNYLIDIFNIRKSIFSISFYLSQNRKKGFPIVLTEKPIHTITDYILHQKQQDSLPVQLFLLFGIPHEYTLSRHTKNHGCDTNFQHTHYC